MDEILKLYLDELEAVRPISDKELRELLPRSVAGDPAARNRVIEGSIKDVMGLLFDYTDKGIDMGDLICEANLALAGAVAGYDGVRDFRSYVAETVKKQLAALIRETGLQKEQDEDLAARVNELSDVSVEMVQELGRQPTTAELAHRLLVSEEEIDALIRMSMDALQ